MFNRDEYTAVVNTGDNRNVAPTKVEHLTYYALYTRNITGLTAKNEELTAKLAEKEHE